MVEQLQQRKNKNWPSSFEDRPHRSKLGHVYLEREGSIYKNLEEEGSEYWHSIKREYFLLSKLEPIDVKNIYFTLEVGGKNKILPTELKFLEQSIEESKYMLELEEGWDGEDAKPYLQTTWDKAIIFIIDYGTWIYAQTGKIISAPNILHSKSGSVDLLWQKEHFRLLINIPESDIPASFYGDNYQDEKIKGTINLSKLKSGMALTIADFF